MTISTTESPRAVVDLDIERLAARMVGIGFHGPQLTAAQRELIARGVRNVILFSRNIEDPQQLAGLTYDIKRSAGADPLMMSVDQEGGRVLRMREPFTLVPSARELGKIGDEKLAYQVGQILARELRAVNFDMNLAPVVDVDTNPGNPVISSRSFGESPELVSRMGVAVVRGLQDTGVGACAKHFPGHGDTSKDSHHELPTLPDHDLARLLRIELPPFQAVIAAGVASVMSSHVIYSPVDGVFPATLSRAIIDGLLRKRLGFDGLVVSDDMQMKAIADHYGFDDALVHGTLAGMDLFWICHSADLQDRAIRVLIKATQAGDIPRSRLEQAVRRQDAVFARFVRPPRRLPDVGAIGTASDQALAERIRRLADATLPEGEDPTEVFARQQHG